MDVRHHPTRSVALALGLVTLCSGVLVPPVSARLPRPPIVSPEQVDPVGEPAPGEGLTAAVSAVPATSQELDAAEAERDRLLARQEAANEELSATTAELSSVERDRVSVGSLVGRRDAQILKAETIGTQLRKDLRAVAIEWFITGFDVTKALDPTLSAEERDQLERGRVLSETAAADTISDERYASSRLASLLADRERLDRRRGELERRSAELSDRSGRLGSELVTLTEKLTTDEGRIAEARMTATIDGTDLSTGALDAYWRASQSLASSDAGCGVTWWALAGIGRTESRHGTYRGASVSRAGVVTPPIYGPELDGSNTFAVVPDSDGGRLDGTNATDRAVGPMQFLPSTWEAVGRDGSGDQVEDPQNLYDAALSAGVYLCRSGPNLRDEARLRSAYFTYNRSQEYVEVVMGYSRGYEAAVDLPG